MVLDFHHIGHKNYGIANMLHAFAGESIKREVKKCIVLCANCHRRRTARELGWFKTVHTDR